MAPDIILNGNIFTRSEVGEIAFNGFSYFVMGDRVTLQAPTGSGGTVYTAGAGMSLANDIITNTKPSPTYSRIGSDGTSLTYQPSDVTTLAFQNFTKTFSQNILTLTPEVPPPLTAGFRTKTPYFVLRPTGPSGFRHSAPLMVQSG